MFFSVLWESNWHIDHSPDPNQKIWKSGTTSCCCELDGEVLLWQHMFWVVRQVVESRRVMLPAGARCECWFTSWKLVFTVNTDIERKQHSRSCTRIDRCWLKMGGKLRYGTQVFISFFLYFLFSPKVMYKCTLSSISLVLWSHWTLLKQHLSCR